MTPGEDGGPRPCGLSRRRLLAGIGGVGAVGMASGIGTGAYLADREAFADNVFSAGEVGLTVDGEPTDGTVSLGPFEVDRSRFDDKPTPEAFNVGARANPVRVWLATLCPDGDLLADFLEVEVVVDGESVTNGYRPLSEVKRHLATGVRIDAGCLVPDETVSVEVHPYLPPETPDIGGEATDLTVRLYAEQCRHVSEADAENSNPFADSTCEGPECVPCADENGVTIGSLTLRYLGDEPADVVVAATGGGAGGVGTGGTVVFDEEVDPNGEFVVDGSASPTGDPDWIGPNIYVDDGSGTDESSGDIGANGNSSSSNGNGNSGSGSGNGNSGSSNGDNNNGKGNGGNRPAGVNIHTSCSVSLAPGQIYGDRFEVVEATTTDGEPICGSEEL